MPLKCPSLLILKTFNLWTIKLPLLKTLDFSVFVGSLMRSHVHSWHFVYIKNWFGKRQNWCKFAWFQTKWNLSIMSSYVLCMCVYVYIYVCVCGCLDMCILQPWQTIFIKFLRLHVAIQFSKRGLLNDCYWTLFVVINFKIILF